MASSYPSGLDSLSTTKADATATLTDHKNHHNDLADAVNKIEAELGTLPKGSYATVKARLEALDPPTFNTQTANYTLVLADANKIVGIDNAAARTLTVPTNATVAFPVGTAITIRQPGAGQTTVSPAGGVTLNSRGSAFKLAGQYAYATLVKVASDTWELSGDITV
jgi:hypothetical protein